MVEPTCNELMEKAIEKAKKIAEKRTNNELANRRWIEATPNPSYGCKDYTTKLFVLEGSPPKAFILSEFSSGIIKVFGGGFKPIHTLRAYDYFYDDLGEHRSHQTASGWATKLLFESVA
jgi:hypothetical protein